ncbi:sensor histidine kinase [Miniimonas arenae]|uniref:sensor histidine kinase n=1 Tax=Miniimonas arenae TaxID=676201 RepID=UPI0028A69ED6|nr:histidine kinase [Miniimonas arenae]
MTTTARAGALPHGGAGATPASRSGGRHPARPRAGVAVAIAAATPALAGGTLQLASGLPVTADILFLVVDVVVGVVYGAVAGVILSRRSHPVAWLVALTGVGGGVAALGGGWASFTTTHPGLAGQELAVALLGSAWVPGTLALFLVVPWLVRETPLGVVERVGLAAGIATTATLTVQRVLAPMWDNGPILAAVVAVGLVTAASVAWRHRRGPVAERPGLGLLAAGTAVMAVSFLPLVLVPYTGGTLVLLVPVLHLVAQALFPAALLVTVLRTRMWGIDLAISRAVLAGLLTLGLVLVYAGLVWTASRVVGSSAVAQVVAAVGVVLAVDPIRRRLEVEVRRLVWGDATSPGRAALRIGATLSAESDAHELLDRLAAAVGESLRLESVELVLGEPRVTDGADPLVAEVGRWGTPTSVPVRREVRRGVDGDSGASALGSLAVTPRPGERLDARTLEALSTLEPVVAVGLGLVRATAEVARARDAATGARLAERRLIRRELHDGIGPWLSGLRLGLQGARNVLPTDPQAADAVLAALQAEVVKRVEDVRALSRSLLPPVLEERGLGAALGELVAQHATAGFAVELDVAPTAVALGELDPRVAAAAYAVASEAVLNASRHSGATTCRLAVAVESGGTLVVVCEDAGRGRLDAPDGVGSRSMRERVRELGGELAVGPCADGTGTRVHARVPLVPAEAP